MLKKYRLFLLLVFVAISCSKDKLVNSPPTPESQPDSIYYTLCDSTVSMNTILYWTPFPFSFGCQDIPTPGDSSAFLNIDIDGDTIADFTFSGFHYHTTSFCGSHCHCTDYRLSIQGIHAEDSIAIDISTPIKYPASYDTSTSVTNSANWSNSANLNFLVHSLGSYYFSEMYIGIKKNTNFGWIHLAPKNYNGVYVKEFAINLTPNNSIIAGQKN